MDLHVHRGERVALLGRTAPARRPVLHLNGILRRARARCPISGLPVVPDNHLEVRRRVGIVFRTRRPALHVDVRDDVASAGQPRAARRELSRGSTGPCAVDNGGVCRPPTQPPLLRPAATRRHRDGARQGARDPRARRAVVQPRPHLRRELGELITSDVTVLIGHPRPALRPPALRAFRRALRRHRRGRRFDPRAAGRRRAAAPSPPRAPVGLLGLVCPHGDQ